MPQTTRGYRYPDGTAKIGEFDLHVKDLADDIEAKVKRIESGSVSISIAAVNTVYSQAVTFATPFPAVPNLAFSYQTATPHQVFASFSNLTVNGFTIYVLRTVGTFQIPVHWIARG